ncbi:MAG: DUF5995 family protein [Candidatus Nanohaloarchaea archaeon]
MSEEFVENLELEEDDSIDDFVEKLEELKKFLKEKNRDSLLPFLEAYLRITRDVREFSEEGEFDDPEALERLDLEFGRLYLEPMKKYLAKGEKQEPWENYFEYVEQEDSIPLLELALGINAHINADLATAIERTDYRNREDFEKINKILRKNLRPVLVHLAVKHRDPTSFGVLGVPPLALKGLGRVREWRDFTWRNARSPDFSVEEVNKKTEFNAGEMIELVHRKDLAGILKKPRQVIETRVSVTQ